MTNLKHDAHVAIVAIVPACLLASLLALCGCSGSEPEKPAVAAAPAPRPTAPSKPAAPAVVPVSQLMSELGIDERVSLPEDKAPAATPARRAILEFFDGFARGDDAAVGTMLSAVDRPELNSLVGSGSWARTTSQITQIDVQTGQSPEGQSCALAIFYVSGDFQPQMWYYTVDDAGPRFEAVAAPPDLMNRIGGTDWITGWFELLNTELALADEPDEELVVPKKVYTDTSNKGGKGGPGIVPDERPSAPENPNKPAPSGPGKRPKKSPRPAPGKG